MFQRQNQLSEFSMRTNLILKAKLWLFIYCQELAGSNFYLPTLLCIYYVHMYTFINIYAYVCIYVYLFIHIHIWGCKQSHCFGLYSHTIQGKQLIWSINKSEVTRRFTWGKLVLTAKIYQDSLVALWKRVALFPCRLYWEIPSGQQHSWVCFGSFIQVS